MPLIDASGLKDECFALVGPSDPLPAGDVILPLARLATDGEAVLARGDRLGVRLPNTAKPEAVEPFLDRLALVAVEFPSFADGRGFSLAKRLRNLGYGGVLRAVGPLIADQMRHALGSGFDEIEAPDAMLARQPLPQWLAALSTVTLRYQRNGTRGVSILDRRRAAAEVRSIAHAA